MLQVTTEQSQVIVAQHLDVVTDDASVALAVFHKVDFHLMVMMERIGMLFLVAFHQMVAVFLRQSGYFGNDFAHDAGIVSGLCLDGL